VAGRISAYFTSESFWVEYSVDVSEVPQGVAVIPFIAQVLPVAWLFDAEIICPSLDADFLGAVPDIRHGYEAMYPMFTFNGALRVANIVQSRSSEDAYACFFSGGVDAYQTLFEHMDQKPSLIAVWGADVDVRNSQGWRTVEMHVKGAAEMYGLDYVGVKSNFRKILDESALSQHVYPACGDNWWHGFQHGIGLLGCAGPLAFARGYKTIYIASSFTEQFHPLTCASHPTIDNYVQFCGCSTVHNGYSYERQDKVGQIVEFAEHSKVPVRLRVCWESSGGGNCCSCEKCIRTIIEIMAEGRDPRVYGFGYRDQDFPEMMRKLRRWFASGKVPYPYQYALAVSGLRRWCSLGKVEPALRWLLDYDFGRYEAGKPQSAMGRYYLIASGLRRTFSKTVKKVSKSWRR
jgi:hypothetical protein